MGQGVLLRGPLPNCHLCRLYILSGSVSFSIVKFLSFQNSLLVIEDFLRFFSSSQVMTQLYPLKYNYALYLTFQFVRIIKSDTYSTNIGHLHTCIHRSSGILALCTAFKEAMSFLRSNACYVRLRNARRIQSTRKWTKQMRKQRRFCPSLLRINKLLFWALFT